MHFDGEKEPRELPQEAEVDVELAYAITCHKAQGSSAATVVLIADDGMLVTREWLYTGITRGRELKVAPTPLVTKSSARPSRSVPTGRPGLSCDERRRGQGIVE